MGTPKKPLKKKIVNKSPGGKKPKDEPIDPPDKKKFIDDDEDEDFDMGVDELGNYESFEGFEEDEDY